MNIRKILVVDDDEDDRLLIQKEMEAGGNKYELIFAGNGLECIKKARAENPDLILMDIIMPEMPGGDVVRLLKDGRDTQKIPIFFLSGVTGKDPVGEEWRGVNVAGEHYPAIGKPFKRDIFLKVLNKHCG